MLSDSPLDFKGIRWPIFAAVAGAWFICWVVLFKGVKKGIITAFANCGFSILCGVLVFSVLGNMAAQQGVGVDKVVSSGVGLAFVTIPKAINSLPGPVFFGTLFFLALIFAGLSSMVSICEVSVASLMEKFDISRKKAVTLYCLVGLVTGAIFASHSGLLVLDIVDRFINNFGVLAGGLMEIIFLTWVCKLDVFKDHINRTSDFRVGSFWGFCLKIVTPGVLGYMSVANLLGDLKTPYGGYSATALFYFGWLWVVAIVVLSFIFQAHSLARNRR